MTEISFAQLEELLNLNLGKKHVSEAVAIVKHAECIFFPGIIGSQEHLSSLYQLRFMNAKERNTMGEEYLNDYEKTVSELKTSQAKTLGLTSVYSKASCFLIFFEPESKNILGILKSNPNEYTRELIANPNNSPGFEKYSKGKSVK